jgi:hypothetical protein
VVQSAGTQAGQKHKVKSARHDTARVHTPARSAVALAHASQRPAARTAAKAKKPGSKPRTVAPVDSDVALISAVIQHANNQRAEAEAAEAAADCDMDSSCAAKATPEP